MRNKQLSLLMLALCSCSGSEFAKYSKLGSMRVLAMIVSAPETAAGSTVSVTPFVSYPDMSGTETLTHTAIACSDPGVSIGAEPKCATDIVTVLAESSVTMSSATKTESLASFSVAIPATYLDMLSAEAQLLGRDYLVLYTLSSSKGSTVTVATRIVVSSSPEPNQNPSITDIEASGATFSTYPESEVLIKSVFPTSAAEIFSTGTEELLTTWFTNYGTIANTRTVGAAETKFSPDASRPDGAATVLVAVVRDSRGGVAVLKREL
jgi:hypothetical protein